MGTTFNRSINEDFGGMLGLARNVTGGDTVKVMSRMSDLGSDHAAVQNYDRLNMDLTKSYATKNATHQAGGGDAQHLYLAWDERYAVNENSDRGPFDRYVWAGQFEKKAPNSGGTVFTHSEIDNAPTDGMMLIPSPYSNFVPGSHDYWGSANFESIRLKIKSNLVNGIPPDKFVPLFGYTYTCAGAPQAITNSSGSAYRSNVVYRIKNGGGSTGWGGLDSTQNSYRLDGAVPNALASNVNNLDQWSNVMSNSYQNWHDYARNTTVWFLYAHDGNGKGMIVMTSGEGATSTNFEGDRVDGYNRYRPYNGYFGDKNGYLNFKQPNYLNEWLNGETPKSLQDLWDYWSVGGAGRETFDETDLRKASSIRHMYLHWRDMNDQTIGGYQNNIDSTWNTQLRNGHSQGPGYHHYNQTGNQWTHANALDGARPNSAYLGAINWSPFQIIAFGDAGANFTLKDSEEIIINANTIGQAGINYHKNLGIQSTNTQSTDAKQRHNTARQILYTGKILNFNFRDVPGQMWHDYYRLYTTASYYTNQYTSKGPYALVLRPTHEDKMQVESVSYSNYTNDDAPEEIGGDTNMNTTYRSSASTSYLFGGDGASYDPLEDAKADPARITDTANAWTGKANLIDLDLSSRAQLDAEGHENALYIELSGTDATLSGVDSSYDITSMGITVRGITLSAIDYHKLRFAIVDGTDIATQTTYFTTITNAQVEHQDRLDIGDIPISNTTISPIGDGAYHIQFQTTLSENHTYDVIKGAYLKIWAEKS
jgi:hypothetical protein